MNAQNKSIKRKQPFDYGINEEVDLLHESVRRFYADHYSYAELHELVANDASRAQEPQCNWNEEHWKETAALGWPALCLSEPLGGMGLPLVAGALVAEAVGYYACPTPIVQTIAASILLNSCHKLDPRESHSLVAEQISNGAAFALAVSGSDGLYDSSNLSVRFSEGKLNGSALRVTDAKKAQFFFVRAKTESGSKFFCVSQNASGLEIKPDVIGDLTRDQATLEFNNVVVTDACMLADEGYTQNVIEHTAPAVHVLVAADCVGTCETLLEQTTDYAKTRKQFDRIIGFYQAVKHPLVNVMVANDEAKTLVYAAACSFDHEPDGVRLAAAMAKSAASDAAGFAASRAIQLHGGIAMTWDCFVHMYAKRAIYGQYLYGDGVFHRKTVSALVLD